MLEALSQRLVRACLITERLRLSRLIALLRFQKIFDHLIEVLHRDAHLHNVGL